MRRTFQRVVEAKRERAHKAKEREVRRSSKRVRERMRVKRKEDEASVAYFHSLRPALNPQGQAKPGISEIHRRQREREQE